MKKSKPNILKNFSHLIGHPVQLNDSRMSVHIWSQEIFFKTKGRYTPIEISQEDFDERMSTELNKVIPFPYPDTIEKCLEIIEKVRYESFGFPMFFLDYDYSNLKHSDKKWSCGFRNPCNFENPTIECKTPIQAVHKIFDFLRTRNFKMRIK